MRLSDTKVRNAKGKAKPYKMSDGGGLYLLVNPNSRKYWRMKYRFLNQERLESFGVYPDISLADARERRDAVRKLKAKGIVPRQHKREQEEEALRQSQDCFEIIAREWHALKINKWSAYYAKQVMQRMEADLFPKIDRCQ